MTQLADYCALGQLEPVSQLSEGVNVAVELSRDKTTRVMMKREERLVRPRNSALGTVTEETGA